MTAPLRGVVFDMDGVLLDTERIAALAFDYAGIKTGIGPAGYMTPRLLGLSTETARPVWLAEFGGRYDEDGILAYTAEYKREYYKTHAVPAKPGLLPALRMLKDAGFRLAVASSTERSTVESELSSVGASGFFDHIVCGDMVTRSKPDPEIYLRACGSIGLPPRECAAVEDARSGIVSAHTAGMRVIMVPDLLGPDAELISLADAICPDLIRAASLCLGWREMSS